MTTPEARDPLDFSINRLFLSSTRGADPLRVGILIDGTFVPAFGRKILEDLIASDFIHIACFVSNAQASNLTKTPPTWIRRLRTIKTRRWWSALAYHAYTRLVSKKAQPQPDPEASVDCSDLLATSKVIRVNPIQSGFVDRFSEDDVRAIADLNLDVAIRLGFRILRGDVLNIAKHGIWSFHHGDSSRYRGGPPYIWELIEGNRVSGVVLQKLQDKLDAGPILGKALFSTTLSFSQARNAFAPYWATTHFVIRELRALHQSLRRDDYHQLANTDVYSGKKAIYRTPDNSDMLFWLLRLINKKLRNRIKTSGLNKHWRIAIRRTDTPLFVDSSKKQLQEFRWLPGPIDGFWADPFLFSHEGRTWLFFEEFDYQVGKGILRVGEISESGDVSNVRTAMECPYHLSYPHVFSDGEQVYMIPESCESGRIDLYRATEFPTAWTLETTLLHLKAVDTTVFKFRNRWWMLTSPMTADEHAPLTYVFTSDHLHGPWVLASHKPICDDVHAARGGGSVFSHHERMFRPVQDCSESYGRAFCFEQLEVSDEGVLTSKLGTKVEPNWLPMLVGTHSYSRCGQWECIDGQFLERRETFRPARTVEAK